MTSLDAQILEELKALRQIVQGKNQEPPTPEPQAAQDFNSPPGKMMTEYDCLLICASGDVCVAIDRWNKSRRVYHKRKR